MLSNMESQLKQQKADDRAEEVLAETSFADYDLKKYFTKNISYELTDQKRAALQKFISMLLVL